MIAVAVVTALLVWAFRRRWDSQEQTLGILLALYVLATPWAMAVLPLFPSRLSCRLLYLAGEACVAAFIFAVPHLADGDPVGVDAIFLIVQTLSLGLACGIGYFVSTLRSETTG
jgi:hypothetical protein